MTSDPEILALRKQLLQARAVLHRLRIRRDARELRRSLGPMRIARAAAGSTAGRIVLLGMATALLPASRGPGMFRLLARILQFTRVGASLYALWTAPRDRAHCVRQRTDRAISHT
ncbi:MAG TPA: hypothetical protein VFV17_05940 [Usitatibacteraceae bacterium]|nr:hypothetical protein [Usitatibacteraceae bacterium]